MGNCIEPNALNDLSEMRANVDSIKTEIDAIKVEIESIKAAAKLNVINFENLEKYVDALSKYVDSTNKRIDLKAGARANTHASPQLHPQKSGLAPK
jgi:predicted  nucleic acid-binding Zn-ribbon protein